MGDEGEQIVQEQQGEPGPILGKFVKIIGLADEPVPTVPYTTATGENDPWVPQVVNGEEGQCVDWEGFAKRVYMVVTFSGLLAKVPEANLEEFEPPSAEAGGFDCAWPAGQADVTSFSVAVAETLVDKDYCVVQTFLDEQERADALTGAEAVKESEEYRMELEPDYLGRKNTTNPKKLKQDMPESEPEDAVSRCNHQLTELGLLLYPLAPDYLGFNAASHSKAVARIAYKNRADMEKNRPGPLTDDDVEDNMVKNHILFLRTRKICMLYMINGGGGEVVLHPNDGRDIVLPAGTNKLLLFRHDKMSFTYKPQGDSLAIQAWMLGDMPAFQLTSMEGSLNERYDALGLIGPKSGVPEGLKPQIQCMQTRIPGDSSDPIAYWNMAVHCTDCVTQWPINRFDEELYYSSDPNDVIYGKAYTNHGGFLQFHELVNLSNEFFGISENEAYAMSMNQRMWCEIGYETLHRANFTKKTLNTARIGTYLGDVGSDWHDNTKNFSYWCYDPDYSGTGVSSAVCPARLSYIFGMVGPTMTFDTACSASLYATHAAHMGMLNMHEWDQESDGHLVGGVNSIGPSGHVGNCQGNILTHTGRCFTFDEAADGYQRGEGTAGFFMKFTKDMQEMEDRLACLMGSVSSHDGKSASLTAPSGPAQQVMIRHGLRFAGIGPDDMSFTECHGTGTALGDPIEMGAIAAVIVEEREDCLPHTTPKSNIGHLESCAGVSGLTRLVLGLLHGVAAPNVHFRKLNPHVDMEGYPRIFQNEIFDTGMHSGYAGCSSFGFGGANARCELYAVAKHGAKAKPLVDPEKLDFVVTSCPRCSGNMSFPDSVAVPAAAVKGTHKCSLLREEFADYEVCNECYTGSFRYGTAVEDLDAWNADMEVHISGTWSAWGEIDEMVPDGEGSYTTTVVLGDTCVEYFHLLTNYGTKIYPATKKANETARVVVGSKAEGEGRNWCIDGRRDGAKTGDVYRVTLQWGDRRSISWAPEPNPTEDPIGGGFKHRYFITGPWLQWGTSQMTEVEPGVYEKAFKLGKLGKEEFHVVRDRDSAQVIHPASPKAEDSTILVRGPDTVSKNHFLLRGKKREDVTVQLHVKAGEFRVIAYLEYSGVKKEWRGSSDLMSNVYHVTGTFNQFQFGKMEADKESPRIFKHRVTLKDWQPHDFQILVDEDRSQVLYPSQSASGIGDALLMGPDDEGKELYWQITGGQPGVTVEITLDFTQADRHKMVTWKAVQALADA